MIPTPTTATRIGIRQHAATWSARIAREPEHDSHTHYRAGGTNGSRQGAGDQVTARAGEGSCSGDSFAVRRSPTLAPRGCSSQGSEPSIRVFDLSRPAPFRAIDPERARSNVLAALEIAP